MKMDDASCTILSSDTRNLVEARDVELHKVLKLKLILNGMRSLNLGSAESPEIRRALRQLSVADYIRLGDEQDHLLDLQDFSSYPPLSYTDCKVVRTKLVANLHATLTPIAKLSEKIRSELPDALKNSKMNDDVQLTQAQEEIIRLQKEQQGSMEKLLSLRNHKCALLIKAAELKMGPNLGNELKVQQAQAQLLQTKADLLRIYFINEIFSRSEHSLKAHKEVDMYLDELLSGKQVPADSVRR